MVVEWLTPVAGWALGKAADTAWTVATDQVQTKLQRTDIERAIKAGLAVVQAWEQTLEIPELLFKRCDDKQKRQFLGQVFVNAGVVEQLQRPLAGKGEPDVELLQPYFEQVAQDIGVELTQDSLPQWLTIFTRTYFAKTALFIKYELARQRYLEQLAIWYDDVKFLGISVAGQEDTKSEKLLQIFVMPDIKQRTESKEFSKKSGRRNGISTQAFQDLVKSSEKSGVTPDNLADLLWLTSYGEKPKLAKKTDLRAEQQELAILMKQEGKTFSAVELLKQSQSHRCVLLGAPGSGKTTLMSYFAVALATDKGVDGLGIDDGYLPIVVRIRDWVQSDQTGLLDYIRTFATDKLAVKDLPEGFFEHWLEAGKALILLDGLDEVANEARRDDVVNQIEVFLQGQPYRENPAIITSRPAGYKQAYFRTEEFPHYDLLPFDQLKIDEFIKNWYDTRIPDAEKSQQQQQTLKKALAERDRMQVLAKNPLLLTIIALIHRYEAYLPRDRHQLYNRAVETLLTNWDAGKDIDYTWPLHHLKRDAVRRVMEQLAYWIHSEGSVGDDEGGTLIDREELIEQLSGFIQEEANCKRYEAEADADRFLTFIRSRTGLLNEQGQDRYAFVHKTFQEYLTAEDIRYRQVEDGFEVVREHIDDYLHDPHWEEVLLLLIAQQPKKRVAQLMQQILEHDTPYEHWLHRNLFFAADCLAENVKLVDSPLVNQILGQLVEFLVSDSPLISFQLQQQAEKCLLNLGETDFQNPALQQIEARRTKLNLVKLQQLRFSLGQEMCAISVLIDLLSHDEAEIRSNAASTLGRFGHPCSPVVNSLLKLLSDSHQSVRSSAANALGKLSHQKTTIVQDLLSCLCSENCDVRSSAISALGKVPHATQEVTQALMDSFNDKNEIVRFQALLSISNLGEANPVAIQAVVECLEGRDSGDIRTYCALVLGSLGKNNSGVIEVLFNHLNDTDRLVRWCTAQSLRNLGKGNDDVLKVFIDCLTNSDQPNMKFAVAMYLRNTAPLDNLDPFDKKIVNALLPHLKAGDSKVRRYTAEILGEQQAPESLSIKALRDCLSDNDQSLRSAAAFALGKLGSTNPEVIMALRKCLDSDDTQVCSNALASLVKLGQADNVEVQALVKYLADEDASVRSRAAEALRDSGPHAITPAPQLANWIEQHQWFEHVGLGIDTLWSVVINQA